MTEHKRLTRLGIPYARQEPPRAYHHAPIDPRADEYSAGAHFMEQTMSSTNAWLLLTTPGQLGMNEVRR